MTASVAPIGAGLLLTSRKLHSREMLGQLDRSLLALCSTLAIAAGRLFLRAL